MAIYLDHNATTPLEPRVLEAMLPYLEGSYGNPSSRHRFGRLARAAVDTARERIAALVGAQPGQVVFTSGGTEANALALLGAAHAREGRPGRVAISSVEHASLRAPARDLARAGWQIHSLLVDSEGRVDLERLRDLVYREGAPDILSVMAANNETGVLQDLDAIAALAAVQDGHTLMHTDAVQAAGKIPLDFASGGVQLMSLSAHKIYGPKGIGALILDRSLELTPLLPGGGQERGLRGGTENVPSIVGFGAAAEIARAEMASRTEHLVTLQQRLEQGLNSLPGVRIFGAGSDGERLPNTTSFALPGVDGETLVMQLDRKGIALSSGSACSSAHAATGDPNGAAPGSVSGSEPSPVLLAMGIDPDLARCAVRVSLGAGNSLADVERLLGALEAFVVPGLGQEGRWASAAGGW